MSTAAEKLRLKHPYRVPGLDGTWQIMGLETVNMAADGTAKLHLNRVTDESTVSQLIAGSSLGAGLEREIRAKVAAELRAALIAGERPPWAAVGNPDRAASVAEWAARIAEGGDTDGRQDR